MSNKIVSTTVTVKKLPGFVLRNIRNHYLIVPIKAHLDGHVLSTNEIGAFVWGVLEKESQIGDIVNKVANKYGKQLDLEKDVLSCIDKYLNLGLIQKI